MPALPIVCSDDGGRGAAGMEACPTLTSTVPDGTDAGKPLAVTAAVPPTWATRLVTKGYHVGFADGTILLVGNGAPKVVATQLGRPAGLAVGLDGSLYVADPSQHMVHRVDRLDTSPTWRATARAAMRPPQRAAMLGQRRTPNSAVQTAYGSTRAAYLDCR